ncbi:uncharacterized protein LOC141613845 [Silene latifolia]|uniref:uncharacterized protein LOC141613845 n=1 Tax=Silene latifolia TaxID=37657 RepID=UPI003D78353B
MWVRTEEERWRFYFFFSPLSSFCPKLPIPSNIPLAHEAIFKINSKKKGKSGSFAFMADMSKAYDWVRWDFLQAVLYRFGFSENMIQLIMNCVSTVSYEVLFNGAPLKQFKPECGLTQGDPLSPYLFLLCMEVLSSNVISAQAHGSLTGFKICRGQRLNEEKCGLLFSPNMTLRRVQRCLTTFNIKTNKGIGKYLGMPLEFQGSKKEIFKGLLDNVTKRVSSWNGVFLSPTGRLTLISSVLSNISIYFLSVFKIPLNSGGWNHQFIQLLFTEETTNRILATVLRTNQTEDVPIWPATQHGSYTVKSGYGMVFSEFFNRTASVWDMTRLNTRQKDFCGSRLWHMSGPRSWKILVWKILSNSLPVGEEFERRNIPWNTSCCLCQPFCEAIETVDHIFKDCEITARVWASSPLGVNSTQTRHISARDWIINWILYLRTLDEWEVQTTQFLAIIVSLWNLRNNARFRGERFIPEAFFRVYNRLVSDALNAVKESKTQVVLMVDASWRKSCHASWGWVAMDSEENVICNGSGRGFSESPLQAEAIGVLKALIWARDCGFLHVEVSSDCLQLLFQ